MDLSAQITIRRWNIVLVSHGYNSFMKQFMYYSREQCNVALAVVARVRSKLHRASV